MSNSLIDRNPDLKQLRDEGYDIEVRPKYLLVRSVPYVNSKREVSYGTLVSELTWAGDLTTTPNTHVAHFIGDHPCHKDGSTLAEIRLSSGKQELEKGLVVDHGFSARPPNGYLNFYDKVARYVQMISSPAQTIDPNAKAQTFPVIEAAEHESVFKYADTASSRAGISALTHKLEIGKVGIVGVGGTGSYILDLVAKTPVKEIHLFDGDEYLNHNAFRSPGAPSIDELRLKPRKAIYLRDLYSRMRRGIFAHDYFITEANIEELRNLDFAFLSMDGGPGKKLVVERLVEWRIPFIDVGMGLALENGALGGILTVTTCTKDKSDHLGERIPFEDATGNNDYSRNIQIADLNALNAALAVIKWKKMCGFYHDFEHEHYSAYAVAGNALINEDCP